jgi:hypothetical protein
MPYFVFWIFNFANRKFVSLRQASEVAHFFNMKDWSLRICFFVKLIQNGVFWSKNGYSVQNVRDKFVRKCLFSIVIVSGFSVSE